MNCKATTRPITMNIDAYTMDNAGRAMLRDTPIEDLKELLVEITDEVCDIKGQLEDRADDNTPWKQKALTALTYRKRVQRFVERIIREKQDAKPDIEVTFMQAAQKLLDPQTFNTILLAAAKYSKTGA